LNIWDDILSKEDRAIFEKGRFGKKIGFGSRPAILVIDVSHAFVEPASPLAGDARPDQMIRSIARLIAVGREKDLPIIFTTNRTPRNDADWGRWKSTTTWSHPELIQDDTWEIIPELAPQPGDSILYKTRPSGFFATDLADLLIYHGIDTTIVTGMTTSGCVRATVVDAFSFNFRVIVPIECVADRAELSHKVSLMEMHMKYADVLSLEEVLKHVSP
jgi:maleamate amidohydrolase